MVSYACTPFAAAEKLQWVAKWFPFFDINNVVLTHRKDLVKADAIVDDSLAFVATYGRAWPGSLLIGVEYPYNRTPDNNVYNYMAGDYKHMGRAFKEIPRILAKHL